MIGIVTKINDPDAHVERSADWLRLAGCKKIFYVDSKKQEGIPELLEYLREEGDVMPWEKETEKEKSGSPNCENKKKEN